MGPHFNTTTDPQIVFLERIWGIKRSKSKYIFENLRPEGWEQRGNAVPTIIEMHIFTYSSRSRYITCKDKWSGSKWSFRHPWELMKKQQCNIWTRSEWSFNYVIISKPTCDKPKAEGRRPESERSERASEASSTCPKCILPELVTCRRPLRVLVPEWTF